MKTKREIAPLKSEPITIGKHDWYYEEPDGIHLVHETILPKGGWVQTDTIIIPWKKLVESVRRKYGETIARKS